MPRHGHEPARPPGAGARPRPSTGAAGWRRSRSLVALVVAVVLGSSTGDGGARTAVARDEVVARPARGAAGALHDLGERRPADPLAGLGAGAGARRRRPTTSRPLFDADQALRRRRRPGALPRRDADDPGAADELPDLQHPARAGARDRGDRLGRLRHGLQPLPRPGRRPGSTRPARRSTTPASSTRARFRRAAAQRKPVILDVKGVKVAFLAYTTDTNGIPLPHPWSVNIASRGARPRRRAPGAAEGAEAVIVNLHWGGEIVPEYQSEPSSGQLALVKKLTASPPDHGDRRPGPARRAADRADQRQVRRLQRGQPGLEPEPRGGAAGSSQDGLIALLDCVADGRHGARVRGVRYVPVFVNHPDYTVLPDRRRARSGARATRPCCAPPTSGPSSVAGRGKGIEPVPAKLPQRLAAKPQLLASRSAPPPRRRSGARGRGTRWPRARGRCGRAPRARCGGRRSRRPASRRGPAPGRGRRPARDDVGRPQLGDEAPQLADERAGGSAAGPSSPTAGAPVIASSRQVPGQERVSARSRGLHPLRR